jgi:hypothetical protein
MLDQTRHGTFRDEILQRITLDPALTEPRLLLSASNNPEELLRTGLLPAASNTLGRDACFRVSKEDD